MSNDAHPIPEVDDFVHANERLKTFKQKHKALMAELDSILYEYNATLEAAEKAVRARGVSAGPFVLTASTIEVDVEQLREQLGDEWFCSVGGRIETRVEASVDRRRLEAYAVSGALPDEVVSSCIRRKIRLSSPKKVELP